MVKQSIIVKHNIEVAHRLHLLPGKCENIHGHSMWVELELFAKIDDKGICGGMGFGEVKQLFRAYLDGTYDHHLLLHKDDLWSEYRLPGLITFDGDPTTENIARWVGEWSMRVLHQDGAVGRMKVTVDETRVNSATWEWEI